MSNINTTTTIVPITTLATEQNTTSTVNIDDSLISPVDPTLEIFERISIDTQLPSYEEHSEPIRIKSNYAFSTLIPKDLYKVMMYGSEKEHYQFQQSIKRTFWIRIGLCLLVIGLIVTGAICLIYTVGSFFMSFLIALIFPLIYLFSQFLWWLHYHKSCRNKDTYLRSNYRLASKFSRKENQQRNQFATNFLESLSLPPSYFSSNLNSPPPEYV
ncbi:hypothetical protein K502DRAFT_324279 [Neoconidiobolus thromboides FSU 785]|nr:hypothetical protein K502DRAFT_324279 [Neoconidiobolus thromboides FSU 785]